MITINGSKYASSKKEFNATVIDSLFEQGGTLNGYIVKTKRGVKLYDMQGKLFAFVGLASDTKKPMLVSATVQDNGKTWYSHSTSSQAERMLFTGKPSYSHMQETASNIYNSIES